MTTETILPADAPLLRGMAEVCDGLGPILAPHGASLTNWSEAATSLRALADVLAALTPEVVAAVTACVEESEKLDHWIGRSTYFDTRRARAGVTALARLHSAPRPAAPAGAP